MHGLGTLMDPGDFSNTSDTRLAVSRIITWTTEPKSVDVRKAAQAVLIALFNLNTPEFSMLLSALPKTFQVKLTLTRPLDLWVHRPLFKIYGSADPYFNTNMKEKQKLVFHI